MTAPKAKTKKKTAAKKTAPETIQFDPEDLTIGDLEDFEEEVGHELFDVLERVSDEDSAAFSAKELKALVWIVKRQENEDFTLEDARNVKVAELDFGDDEDEDEDDEDPSQ